ncbi:hypothetical protein EKD16_12615 [Streptomonospora litoralis]|uniref:Uncharacterized protein n=1 Tax=Streptomonospora litoralis TaxID=2498135 RepID=A0A4P6Q1A2_9ACTN|nr:hypothetical protein EKD16_12615 [Streptomonospora litoralis]
MGIVDTLRSRALRRLVASNGGATQLRTPENPISPIAKTKQSHVACSFRVAAEGRHPVVGASPTRGSRRPTCSRIGATRCTYVRRYSPRRCSEVPSSHREFAMRNNAGRYAHQCPIPRWVRPRAAAAVAHEAHRMARKRPRHQLFVRLVAAAPAEATRKTVIDPQKSIPSGGGLPEVTPGRNERRVVTPPAPLGPCERPRPRPAARLPACAGPVGTQRRRLPAPAPAISDAPESAATIVAAVAKIPKNAAGSRHTGTIVPPPCDITDTRAPPGSPASSPTPSRGSPAGTGTDARGLALRRPRCRFSIWPPDTRQADKAAQQTRAAGRRHRRAPTGTRPDDRRLSPPPLSPSPFPPRTTPQPRPAPRPHSAERAPPQAAANRADRRAGFSRF